jgi:hypothetical protein
VLRVRFMQATVGRLREERLWMMLVSAPVVMLGPVRRRRWAGVDVVAVSEPGTRRR